MLFWWLWLYLCLHGTGLPQQCAGLQQWPLIFSETFVSNASYLTRAHDDVIFIAEEEEEERVTSYSGRDESRISRVYYK